MQIALGLAEVSARTRLATWLFLGGLAFLLALTLSGIRWWRRRHGPAGPRPLPVGDPSAGDAARTVARNASIPFAIQLITRAIDFGFVALLYRYATEQAMGAYDFAGLVVVQYLGTLADWGLTVLATREVARDRSAAPAYFRTTARLRLCLALLAIPAAALFILGQNGLAAAGAIRQGLDSRQIALIGILVLTLFPTALSAAATALFQGTERLEIPAAINLLVNIVSAAVRVLALILGYSVIGVAGGALIGASFGALLFALALRRGFPGLAWHGPTLPWRPLLAEGWPLLLNSLLIGVFFRFDTIILNATYGEATVATYGVAYKYISLTQIVPPIVVNALFPLLARRAANDRAGMARAYAGTLRMLLIVALPLAMGFSVLAAPLAGALAEKPEYLPGAAYALAITIWYLPFSFINGLTQYVVIALGRQRAITTAFIVTAVFNVGMNALLVPRYSFIAAAAITIASELVLFLPLRRVLRAEGVAADLPALFWRPTAAALVMGGALWLINNYAGAILAALAGLPVYLGVLVALGAFGADDRALLKRVLRRSAA